MAMTTGCGMRAKKRFKPNRYNPNDPRWADVHTPLAGGATAPVTEVIGGIGALLAASIRRRPGFFA